MAASFPTGLQPLLCDRFPSQLSTNGIHLFVSRTELTWRHLYSWRHNQVEKLRLVLFILWVFCHNLYEASLVVIPSGLGLRLVLHFYVFFLAQFLGWGRGDFVGGISSHDPQWVGKLEHIPSNWQHTVGDGA